MDHFRNGPYLSAIQQALMGYTDPAGPATDPFFANVVFLCHMDGSNGGTTFTDVKGKTITRTGATTSTTQFKFGTASCSLSGAPQYLSLASQADFNFGTGDFTVECWCYQTGDQVFNGFLWDNRTTSTAGINQSCYVSNRTPLVQANSTGVITGATSIITNNVWHHVAVARVSGTTRLFVDGSQSGSNYTDSNTYIQGNLYIGASSFQNTGYTGFIDDFRVTKGVGRYSGSFAVPTAAFPDS